MLAALARSKELAVAELRRCVLERDQCAAEVAGLKPRLASAQESARQARSEAAAEADRRQLADAEAAEVKAVLEERLVSRGLLNFFWGGGGQLNYAFIGTNPERISRIASFIFAIFVLSPVHSRPSCKR